jgi:hypothetical protein
MVPPETIAFTHDQLRVLCALRHQYQQDRAFFTAGERARLRFLRWLYYTGHLVP